MNIAIAGGTGFVGSALTNHLLTKGHTIFILTRDTSNKKASHDNLHYVEWLSTESEPEKHLQDIDAIVNLAGESINSGRWTETRKRRILDSRITATKAIIDIISKLERKPEVLVNASAIGIYGTSLTKSFTEESRVYGSDFLATTVKAWEAQAVKANDFGVRTVLARFGIILGDQEGALPKMVMPYKFFIGGTVGSGEQWLSWVHIDDVIKMIDFSITHQSINGPINVTAPNPKKMNEFGKQIGKIVDRPHWIPAPSFALQLILGEMSKLVLEGQKVMPNKVQSQGYSFLYENLDEALVNILKS